MEEEKSHDQFQSTLSMIQTLLERSIKIQEEDTQINSSIHDIEQNRAQAILELLHHVQLTGALTEESTGMNRERTGLVREQTRLSTKSTELSVIRTDMSRERSGLAGQRTNLAVLRTDLSRSRTSLAAQRNTMAETRTVFSTHRTDLAGSRTKLSTIRTSLAQGRTQLALIRTGLAFFSLSIAFFRMFGISWWSIFDGILMVVSLITTSIGIVSYRRTSRSVKVMQSDFSIPDKPSVVP